MYPIEHSDSDEVRPRSRRDPIVLPLVERERDTLAITTPRSANSRRRIRRLQETSSSESDSEFSEDGAGAKKHVEVGMKVASKDLYRENPCFPWDDWSPDDVGIDVEKASESQRYALIVRREKDPEGKALLQLHSITVQSPLIRKSMDEVFVGYKGLSTRLKKLTFKRPFHEFFYRWDTFQRLIEQEKDEIVLQHINLLNVIIAAEIQPHLENREDLLKNGLVTFEYLWALFEPDSEVFSHVGGQDRLFNLINSRYRPALNSCIFILSCRYIDCDGEKFGWVSEELTINIFDGVKPVAELPVLPSHLHPDVKGIRQRLKERGKAFEQLIGLHYKSYSGFCITTGGFSGSSDKRNIDDGRIIVDSKMYATWNGNFVPNLEPLGSEAFSPSPEENPILIESEDLGRMNHPLLNAFGLERPQTNSLNGLSTKEQPTLTDDQLRLCTPTVRGYCLSSKLWAHFYVPNISDIRWNKEAFHKLILPHDYKEIVLAFVESQLAEGDRFDDVISGKGQGIIMLLSGEPGVGKTLTAESVAEEMKRPLYSMSAGELGDTAREVESSLHKVLEISTKWGAVLLLDECDVFLEQRTVSDINRNKLVSVFLRLLEYYKGVMFLTTNRVSAFDAAFQSRIHLSINYPKLDRTSRKLIWQTFVRPKDASPQYAGNIKDEELDDLAEIDMNGREIKNVVKTARLLASRRRVPLEMEHVQTVLRVKKGSPAMSNSLPSTSQSLSL